MTIKQVWQTEDGALFDTEETARRYEFKQEILAGIRAGCAIVDTEHIVDWLIDNYRIAKIKKLNAEPTPPQALPLGPHGVPLPSNCELDPLSGFVVRKSDGAIMLWNGVCFEQNNRYVIHD